jgi:hypothetical protein
MEISIFCRDDSPSILKFPSFSGWKAKWKLSFPPKITMEELRWKQNGLSPEVQRNAPQRRDGRERCVDAAGTRAVRHPQQRCPAAATAGYAADSCAPRRHGPSTRALRREGAWGSRSGATIVCASRSELKLPASVASANFAVMRLFYRCLWQVPRYPQPPEPQYLAKWHRRVAAGCAFALRALPEHPSTRPACLHISTRQLYRHMTLHHTFSC